MSKLHQAGISATVRIRAALLALAKAHAWQRLGQLRESQKCLREALRDIARAEQFMRNMEAP